MVYDSGGQFEFNSDNSEELYLISNKLNSSFARCKWHDET